MQVIPFAQHIAASSSDSNTLSAVASGLTPSGFVFEIAIQAASGNSSYVSVKDTGTGIVLADLYPPTSANPGGQFCIKSPEGQDGLNPANFTIQYHATGDKANAYAVVE